MLSRFNIVNDKNCSNFNLPYWPECQSYLFQYRKRQALLPYHFVLPHFVQALEMCGPHRRSALFCLTLCGAYRKQ